MRSVTITEKDGKRYEVTRTSSLSEFWKEIGPVELPEVVAPPKKKATRKKATGKRKAPAK